MAERKFWLQVRRWLRPGARLGGPRDIVPEFDSRSVLQPSGVQAANDDRRPTNRSRPWLRRRTQTLDRLEDRYNEISGLIDSIHKHLQVQDERSGQMADALRDLAQNVARYPELAQAQSRQLEAIATQLEAGNARATQRESAMDRLATLAESQTEALHGLGEQVKVTQATHERIGETLNGFGDAMNAMGRSSDEFIKVIRVSQAATVDRDEHVVDLLMKQSRGASRMFIGSIVLASVIVASTGALLLFR